MASVAHRSAGTGTDRLASAAQRAQLIKFLLSIDGSTAPISPAPPTALTAGLATDTQGATSAVYPVVLAGSTVSIRDAAGVVRLGPLSFSSPGQINYVMPAGVAAGSASITITASNGATAAGTAPVGGVAPGLFAINAARVAAATGIRVNADSSQTPVAVFQCGSTAESCVPTPLDVSGGPVYITLYGTGLRGRTSLENVRCTIGGVQSPVLFAGPQGGFPALDQVNVQVPFSLQGRGIAAVIVTVDGQASNPVNIAVR